MVDQLADALADCQQQAGRGQQGHGGAGDLPQVGAQVGHQHAQGQQAGGKAGGPIRFHDNLRKIRSAAKIPIADAAPVSTQPQAMSVTVKYSVQDRSTAKLVKSKHA